MYSLCALEHRHLLPSDHGFGAAARFVTAPATIIERHRLQRFKKKTALVLDPVECYSSNNFNVFALRNKPRNQSPCMFLIAIYISGSRSHKKKRSQPDQPKKRPADRHEGSKGSYTSMMLPYVYIYLCDFRFKRFKSKKKVHHSSTGALFVFKQVL